MVYKPIHVVEAEEKGVVDVAVAVLAAVEIYVIYVVNYLVFNQKHKK
jgi:hypothetical protein